MLLRKTLNDSGKVGGDVILTTVLERDSKRTSNPLVQQEGKRAGLPQDSVIVLFLLALFLGNLVLFSVRECWWQLVQWASRSESSQETGGHKPPSATAGRLVRCERENSCRLARLWEKQPFQLSAKKMQAQGPQKRLGKCRGLLHSWEYIWKYGYIKMSKEIFVIGNKIIFSLKLNSSVRW